MLDCLLVFTILLPLGNSLIIGLFRNNLSNKSAKLLSSALLLVSALGGLITACSIKPQYELFFFEWIDLFDIEFGVWVDDLSLIMVATVTFISAIVHIYSTEYMSEDPNHNRFLAYLSLFTFFMLMLVVSPNLMQMFLAWEGVGLTSYLLVGFWYHKPAANSAALKAFFINRIGDACFLLAMVLCFAKYGTLDLRGLNNVAQFDEITLNLGAAISLLLLLAAMTKSAQIGFHIWLPDAMEGPTPVSALIHSATMVTAGVFLLSRCTVLVTHEFSGMMEVMNWIGICTSIATGCLALVEDDLKKILAYSSCSQLGYMFVGFPHELEIMHLFTHAFFKALLFLGAGCIIHATVQQNIKTIGAKYSSAKGHLNLLAKANPIIFAAMALGILSLMGVFPLASFYSKEKINLAVVLRLNGSAASLIKVIALTYISPLLTGAYSARLFLHLFVNTSKKTVVQAPLHYIGPTMKYSVLALLLATLGTLYPIAEYKYFKDCQENAKNTKFLPIESLFNQKDLWVVQGIVALFVFIASVVGSWLAYVYFKRSLAIKNFLKASPYSCVFLLLSLLVWSTGLCNNNRAFLLTAGASLSLFGTALLVAYHRRWFICLLCTISLYGMRWLLDLLGIQAFVNIEAIAVSLSVVIALSCWHLRSKSEVCVNLISKFTAFSLGLVGFTCLWAEIGSMQLSYTIMLFVLLSGALFLCISHFDYQALFTNGYYLNKIVIEWIVPFYKRTSQLLAGPIERITGKVFDATSNLIHTASHVTSISHNGVLSTYVRFAVIAAIVLLYCAIAMSMNLWVH